MAESNDLKQKLDVISYVAAAILGIGVLAYPMLQSGDASLKAGNIEEKLKPELEEEMEKADKQPAPPVPQWASELEALWEVPGPGEEKAAWVTENRPASLRLWNDVPPPVAVHEPGGVVSIELVRDAQKKKPFLRVTGKISSKNQHIEIEELVLEKKVGDGEFKVVEGFLAVEDFVYEDADIVSGQHYGYRFVSNAVPGEVAEGLPAPILDAAARSRGSNELVTEAPVPLDLTVKVRGYADELTDHPKLVGQIIYWDYSKAEKIVKKNRAMAEEWKKGYVFGEDHKGNPRYSIRSIVPEEDSRLHGVTITDNLAGKKIVFKKEAQDPPSVDSWEPVVSAFEVPEKPPEPEAGGKSGTAKRGGKTGTKPAGKAAANPVAKKPARNPVSDSNKDTSGVKAKPESGKPKKSGGRKRAGFE